MRSSCILEPGDSGTVVNMSSSSPAEPNDSGTLLKTTSSSSPEPDEFGTSVKLSSYSPPGPDDSCTVVKLSSSSQSEPEDSGTIVKTTSSSSSEPGDFGTMVKLSSYSPSEPDDSCTVMKMSSSSQSEPKDSGTIVKISSCSPPEPGAGLTVVNMFENLMHMLSSQYISMLNEETKLREKIKEKNGELLMQKKELAKEKRILSLRQGRKFKEEIIPLHETFLLYKERFSECKKMGNKTKQTFKSISMKLSYILTQLIDRCEEEIDRFINSDNNTDDGSSIIPCEAYNSQASDYSFCRSLRLNMVNKFFPDEFKSNTSNPDYLVVIDGILDKSTQARKCAIWFLYKACNLEILCDDIQYIWIYNSIKLTSYANLMDKCLGWNDGAKKEYMYGIYMNHQEGDFENIYLKKLHQGETDLEQSDRKYKILEARKPRFDRSQLCTSEHITPFCELCGWPSTWLKTFKKRGIYIKEAPQWTTKHIWYNELKDESN